MIRRAALARIACASLVAILVGPLLVDRASAQEPPRLSAAEITRGRSLYVSTCARCHGVNGGGGEGPPLARARLPRAPDFPSLLRIMAEGIPGSAMSGIWFLTEQDLTQIGAFVRSLAPSNGAEEPSVGDAVRGAELYERERCAACHTVGGFGTARGPDLTTVGLRRGAGYLREAVLDPAAALPRGESAMPSDFVDYLMVRIVDGSGEETRGMRVNEDSYTIQIKDARGILHSFYKPGLQALEKQFDRSLMRSYRDAFTDEEMDDLLSYLMSLTGASARVIS